jgi:hypothetical protein
MLYIFRFKNPYKTVGDNWIYGVQAGGNNPQSAEMNAVNLINKCEFLTSEMRNNMVTELNLIKPTICTAMFIMG